MIFQVPRNVEELILEAEALLGLSGILSVPGPSKFGWSKLKKFLQCDYLAFYEAPGEVTEPQAENENQALGTVIHRMLEFHYLPETVCDPLNFLNALQDVGLAGDLYKEAYRIFAGYLKHYGDERSWKTPLGVEQQLEDPTTGLTCKIDLLFNSNGHHKFPDGIIIEDHKTRSRIDAQCLAEWHVDGQVLMYMHLCELNGIEVKGFVANIIGKQKTQRFERVFVPYERAKIDRFRTDLKRWMEGYHRVKNLKELFSVPPERKYACTGRYGLCELFAHCRSGD